MSARQAPLPMSHPSDNMVLCAEDQKIKKIQKNSKKIQKKSKKIQNILAA
jgi:hypothetical protein